MAPTPQETVVERPVPAPRELSGDEVVISGMSGIFPKSDSVQEFMENLYNKVDMVTDDDPRWVFNHPEVPKHLGKVSGMGKFDAQFFRVHYKQACAMEPMSRKLLEHAYSAIFDSGINPEQIRGKKVGVFIGSTFSESEKIVIYENIQRHGFGITGCNKAMYANRISYWIDGKGPSFALDLACASSMACLEHAYRSISTGECDAAIVGGCNLCMHPNVCLNLKRAGFLCLDGKTKCFDKNGDGYVRSDSINVLFLQRAKDAKRIYSQVYYAKGSYSLKPDAPFMPVRESKDIQDFLNEFYSEIDVAPRDVEYVEACGSAIAEADAQELDAVGKVFAKDSSIKVGSVKSNMGHSEPASGTNALTKVCLAYHKGQIPANLHYYSPQDDIPEVKDGRIQVLQDNARFNRSFAALNCFSYTGVNIHVLLKGHYKRKDITRYQASIPRLVTISGRQETGVQKIQEYLKKQPIDPEQIALLHSIHEFEIPGHLSRGYTILDTNENKETVCLSESVNYYGGTHGPLWFVYSGMGSQWAGMGAELMRFPTFAAAIEKCRRVLEPKGIDILRIICDPDKTIYDNILHSFVGIAAVQIGLTDILTEMGIVPDNIIGHSVGELGCAYADGCFTAEEMILAAYSRGLVSVQTPLIKGSMAAVGLGYNDILPLCPPEIEVACHNSAESATISGPADKMKEFVASLTEKSIFAKEVPCSNIAYHSKYIAGAGPGLLKYLSEVIKDPKPRSAKWVSTSVPQDKWDQPMAKLSSAEYHTNNLLNPVLFEETSTLIPDKAVMIEIAPHGLLQAILKRSHKECVHIPLTRRGHNEPVKFLLESIGKMYESGLNPKIDALYPKIEFPVSTETPLLSQLVDWVHNEDWPEAKYNQTKGLVVTSIRDFFISIHDDDYKFLEGHMRNDNYVYPEAGILVLVWETFAMHKNTDYRQFPVTFKDVQFYQEAQLVAEQPVQLRIAIQKGSHGFEVCYNNTKLATGTIIESKSLYHENRFDNTEETTKEDIVLNSEEIYKTFDLGGFTYRGEFQSLHSVTADGKKATIKWNQEWVMFLDALIQLNIIARDGAGVLTPKIIKRLTINATEQGVLPFIDINGEKCYAAQYSKVLNVTTCGGVELDNIIFNEKSVVEQEPEYLEMRSFIPHFLTGDVDINKALQINLQVVADNVDNKVTITEFVGSSHSKTMTNNIKHVADQIPDAEFDVHLVQAENIELDNLIGRELSIGKSDLFVVYNLLGDEKKMRNLYNILSNDTFVLALEQDTTKIHPKYKLFNVITAMSVQKEIFSLLKKADIRKDNVIYLPIAHDSKFNWVPRVLSELQKPRHVTLVSERQPFCGIIGLVKKLRKQYPNKVSVIVVDDYHAPSFTPDHTMFKEQIQKNLTFNILKQGKWGGYYSLSSPKSTLTRNVQLAITSPGMLDSLTWIEAPSKPDNKCLVQVCFTSASYRDVQQVLRKKDVQLGMDFSGIDNNGNKVMGLVQGGALASTVQADKNLLWPVPEHWSLEDAATVPLPYALAYYCLGIRSELLRGQRVFVTSGAGALGQAVISICLANGCQVYTAVNDIHKKRFLLRMFPQLKEHQIGNSRDADSLKRTMVDEHKRCHIVVNCFSGIQREVVMQGLEGFGEFLDVSDEDMEANEDFGMSFVIDEKNYRAVRLSTIFKPEYSELSKQLQAMICQGIETGAVRPLSRVLYPPTAISRAFRLVATSRHRGRVLIRMTDPVTLTNGFSVTPKIWFSSTHTYVVVCDDDGVGIELADHIVKRGASKLAIHFKPSAVGGYFYTKLAKWQNAGVSITLCSENLRTEKGCANLLKEAAKLGPIEGLFIVQDPDTIEKTLEQAGFVDKFNNRSLVVNNLDLVSRNLCGELRHFAVIIRSSESVTDEYTSSIVDKICQSRNEIGLPALALHVDSIKVFDQNTENSKTKPLPVSAVFKALETSLKLKYNNVVTFNLKKRVHGDFLQRIEKVLGVRRIEDIDEKLTLSNLSLSNNNLEEIRLVINETYDLFIAVDHLRKMTISSIKTLGNNLNMYRTNFDSGLGAFYTFIDGDECMATEPMVNMPTKVANAAEKEEELDPKATYLMMIPGFEGHHEMMLPICQRLKMQVQVLQLGPDLTNDNVQQMALNIMKFMKNRFELKSKFYLFGYSFGVNVALELAALIEKEGYVGVVYCLDSSPDALRAQLNAYLGNLSDTKLQDTIVQHMYRLMAGRENEDLTEDLAKAESWSEKIDLCLKKLRSLVHYSNQYTRSVLESAYNRIQTARTYEPSFKLESEIILMKAIPHPNCQKLPDDYNLSKYTKQPVKIFHLASDHALAPHDSRVANIINKLFEPKLIEEFKSKNLCETYLTELFEMF
ncbi:fatty acid synthase-like [Cydia fagiglandana]|uniref:fatty acid synthase-like n=1 Tax=Cydia fagiglandana TaxID=1458189 RepID=UPI002FEE61C1